MPTHAEFGHVVSAADLARQLDRSDLRLVDCRFSLDDQQRGRRDYEKSHLPGAVYAHLDDDLSGPIRPGVTGRHPLPAIASLSRTFSRWGIDEETRVVAYDDATAAIAARLWWLLRWLGHDRVSVLDGGWRAWREGGHPLSQEPAQTGERQFVARPRAGWVVSAEEVDRLRRDPRYRLIDARSGERFRGEVEPIDARAGHIPNAVNAPSQENLDAAGRMLPREELLHRFRGLLQDREAGRIIAYCGSGVTACHNLLAMAHAGLGDGTLYPGSWSEWIVDPNRPIAP